MLSEHLFYHAPVSDERAPTSLLRRCSMCRVVRHITEFHRRGSGFQWWCKSCRRSHDSAYHAKTRPLRLLQKREAKRRLAAWVDDLKTTQPCVDCGKSFHPAAMTFDHLPGTTKRGEVSDLVKSGCTRLAREEIAKCDLVCANCHAVRTHLRRRGLAEDPASYSFAS